MDLLPKELEDIVLDYKYQLEINDIYKKCLVEINEIKYIVINTMRDVMSVRGFQDETVTYNIGKIFDKSGNRINSEAVDASIMLDIKNKDETYSCYGPEYYVEYHEGVYIQEHYDKYTIVK